MKYKYTLAISIILLLVFITLASEYSQGINLKSENQKLKVENQKYQSENTELKKKVVSLEESNSELKYKVENLNTPLSIDYIEVNEKIRFVEKENLILALPQSGSSIMRNVLSNSIVTVCEKALVNNETWLFIQIPTYDSVTNNRGWIKEAETTAYTKDKMSQVQSDVELKAGSEVYEVFNFDDIKNTSPIKLVNKDSGRLVEKREGFCRISQTGGRDIWVKENSVVYPETK